MILHVIERGTGAPVVLLHGLFGAAQNFGAVQRRLAESYRVLAVDQRNHGASPHAAGMAYPALAEDLRETLAARAALPAVLVGHSMGGKTAMAAALRYPESVSRLIVADIAPVAYPPAYRDYAEALRAIPLAPGLTRSAADAALAPAVEDPGIRAFLLQNLHLGHTPHWRIGLDEIAEALPALESWEAPPLGAQFTGPSLFIAGERSNYIAPEHRGAIRALFPAARFITIRNAGHWVHADNPEAFVSILTAFLAVDGSDWQPSGGAGVTPL